MIKILDNRISSRVDADQDPKSHILGPPGDDTVQGPQRENDIIQEIVMTPLRRKTGKCQQGIFFWIKAVLLSFWQGYLLIKTFFFHLIYSMYFD